VSWTGGSAFAAFAALKADVETERAIYGFDDLEHGGAMSCGKDGETAELASTGGDEPGVGERLEDLGEKAFRSSGCGGQIREQSTGLTGELREVNHDANGVVSGTSELHGGVAFFRGGTVCWIRLHAFTDRRARSGLLRSKFPLRAG